MTLVIRMMARATSVMEETVGIVTRPMATLAPNTRTVAVIHRVIFIVFAEGITLILYAIPCGSNVGSWTGESVGAPSLIRTARWALSIKILPDTTCASRLNTTTTTKR